LVVRRAESGATERVSVPRAALPVKLVRIADMINAVESHRKAADLERKPLRAVDIFNSRWLQSFGYALAALYLLYFVIVYRAGSWIVGSTGLPIYTDFAVFWAAGMQTLHGNPAALYDSGEFMKVQAALFPPGDAFTRAGRPIRRRSYWSWRLWRCCRIALPSSPGTL
jgi:hypothetical protein